MIVSFKDADTELLWHMSKTRRIPANLRHVAMRKLEMLDAAEKLTDLLVPPGNRPEALTGDRQGQHAIRVNDQYRLCFVWRDGNAIDVEIVDYH